MSAEIVPFPGEVSWLWRQLDGIEERLYAQRRERQQVLIWMGKMDKEQENAEKAIEELLTSNTLSDADRKTAEKSLKHIKDARQYGARLAPRHKSAEMSANGLMSMVPMFRDKMSIVLRGMGL